MRRAMTWLCTAAVAVCAPTVARGHVFFYDFVLTPQQVVPNRSAPSFGVAHIRYNHHQYLFDITMEVWGIHVADLAPAGPNSVPTYVFVGDRGVNGDPIVDFTVFDALWIDTPTGMTMQVNNVFLGAEQGNLDSDWFVNDEAMQALRTYIQIFTKEFPDGALRGQIVPKPGGTCPADRDGDGFVTGDDYDLYVQLFEVGDSLADFNGDGFVTGDDFDAFVTAFELGC